MLPSLARSPKIARKSNSSTLSRNLLFTIMSRKEELPDDFDESLNLNATPSSIHPLQKEAQNAELKAGADAPESKTADEILDMMRKTPLFMSNLDDAEVGTLSLRPAPAETLI